MPENNNTRPSEELARWFDGNWFKILSISVPILITVATASFFVGQFYANVNAEYEKIRIERECQEKLNQEIDKNRQLEDELNKERTDNLKQLTDNLRHIRK